MDVRDSGREAGAVPGGAGGVAGDRSGLPVRNLLSIIRSFFRKAHWPLAFAAAVALGAILLHGGYAHYEGQFFLVNYLGDRSLFSTIFSAHFNEWGCYQGRELSFIFGWLDAEAIRYSARLGWVHLYSATYFAALSGLAVILWDALPRLFRGLEKRHAGLIVLLLLTSPVAVFSGYYYRTSKILAAFFLVVTLGLLARTRERDWQVRPPMLIAILASATLLGMSDRLGIYFIMLVMLVIGTVRRFDRSTISIQASLLSALVANAAWSTLIGPRLSAIADGRYPDTTDQIVHLRFSFLHSDHYAPALGLAADHLSYFFGNFGVLSMIAVTVLAAIVLSRAHDSRIVLAFAVVALATVAVYVAMYARLTSLPWPASRRVYYWLPQFVVLAVGAGLVVQKAKFVFPRGAGAATALLVLMVGGNLLSLPRHRDAIASQEHRPWIEQSAGVRECIRDGARPIREYQLDAPYTQLCGAVRAAVAGRAWNGVPSAQPNPRLYCRGGREVRMSIAAH